jgi:hypothetical protein
MNGAGFTVNAALTVSRRTRRVVENDEYAAFARRIIRAHGRRVAAGDPDALVALLALAQEVSDATGEAVRGLRATGFSWEDIATRLGVSRQAVQQRWGGEGR